jgi:hypothetical protein
MHDPPENERADTYVRMAYPLWSSLSRYSRDTDNVLLKPQVAALKG